MWQLHSICVTTIKEKSYELDSKETHGKGLREEREVEIMQLCCNLRNKILLKTSTLELIKQQKTKTKWLSYLEPTDITYKKKYESITSNRKWVYLMWNIPVDDISL